MNKYIKDIILFLIMGLIYMIIELLFRGYTYIAMGILGGIDGVLIGQINKVFKWETPLIKQIFLGAVIITASEFFTGCIFNLWLGLNMWNYSNLPFNLFGQICIPFFFIWMLVSLVCILLDDLLRWKLFNEDKPHYIIF